MRVLLLQVHVTVFIHLAFQQGLRAQDTSNSGDVLVNIHADTILEVNGVSGVPKVFGLSAYGGNSDFATPGGSEFLRDQYVDTIGLGQSFPLALPPGPNVRLNVAELSKWLNSTEARMQYEQTAEYEVLKNRGIQKGGAKPFIFLKNPDGYCTPNCEAAECYPIAGTPKTLNTTTDTFAWWSTLFVGYFNFCIGADPGIDLVHIWNEPNAHFWMDGKNGSYFAEFYTEVVTALRAHWPHVKYGGPVTWDPPNGPFLPQSNLYVNWADYALPVMDATLPHGLLDFIDFHAYDANADPGSLQSAIQTTDAYARVRYNQPLPVAITESNNKLDNVSYPLRDVHFYNRTFPLILSTLALLRNPDKVITRLYFDYKSNGSRCYCDFVSGPIEDLQLTPEAEMYQLLGRLSNGTRLHVDISDDALNICDCWDTKGLGNTQVVVEAALVGDNITLALVNMCNCTVSVGLWIEGSNESKVLSSWAAVLDVQSLREVKPPDWPKDEVALTPLSLLLVTYQFPSRECPLSDALATLALKDKLRGNNAERHSKPPSLIPQGNRFTKLSSFQTSKSRALPNGTCRGDFKVWRKITALPVNVSSVMMELPVSIPCNYTVDVVFNASNVMVEKPEQVSLHLSILGEPAKEEWKIVFLCAVLGGLKTISADIEVVSPGVFYQTYLPCLPVLDSGGLTNFQFIAVTCSKEHGVATDHGKMKPRVDRTPLAYFSSAVLVYEVQTSLK